MKEYKYKNLVSPFYITDFELRGKLQQKVNISKMVNAEPPVDHEWYKILVYPKVRSPNDKLLFEFNVEYKVDGLPNFQLYVELPQKVSEWESQQSSNWIKWLNDNMDKISDEIKKQN